MVSSTGLPAAPRTTLASLAPPTLASLAPLLWFAVMLALAVALLLRPAGLAGSPTFIPDEHIPPPGYHVRITLTDEGDGSAADAWTQVVDGLGPALPGHWPLAPPPAETRAWLDAHLLYRLAPADHAALARRLEPAALRGVVAGLRARMASPLFAVGDDDPRRDPLGLRSLSEVEPARLGLLADDGPIATATGDLLAANGTSLLLYLRTGLSPALVHAWVRMQLAARFGVSSGVTIVVLPMTADAAVASTSQRGVADLLAAGLAALMIVLALGLKRVRVGLALVLVVGAGTPLALALAGGLDPLTAPLVLALLAVAASLVPPVGPGTLAPTMRLGLALAPLLLLPYPVWQRWALTWLVTVLVVAYAAKLVTPVLLRLTAARPVEAMTSLAPRPWPELAGALALVIGLAFGTWSLRHVSADMPATDRGDAALLAEFFAPSRMAELATERTASDEAALAAAAEHAAVLAPLVPVDAVRLDAPGTLLLGAQACAARAAGLATLDLPGRVDLLRVILSEQGMRPDAFGEFLRSLDAERQPTPVAALAGTLNGWFTDHLERSEDGVLAVSRVQLRDPLAADAVLPAQLRGPAVFAHDEQRARLTRLGLALAVGAWLSAFVTWLSHRSLAVALTAAIVGVVTQAGALALAVAAGLTSVPLLLPPLLLVGALATDATARACETDSTARPRLMLACQLAPAPVLLVSADPTWRGLGLVLGFGGVLGFALATRAAPLLCARLRRLLREETPA